MNEFVIDTSSVKFTDQDENVLVEGALIDIHYTVVEIVRKATEQKATNEVTYGEVAVAFMEKFQPGPKETQISWATAMDISIKVQKKTDEQKKS